MIDAKRVLIGLNVYEWVSIDYWNTAKRGAKMGAHNSSPYKRREGSESSATLSLLWCTMITRIVKHHHNRQNVANFSDILPQHKDTYFPAPL